MSEIIMADYDVFRSLIGLGLYNAKWVYIGTFSAASEDLAIAEARSSLADDRNLFCAESPTDSGCDGTESRVGWASYCAR